MRSAGITQRVRVAHVGFTNFAIRIDDQVSAGRVGRRHAHQISGTSPIMSSNHQGDARVVT